MSDTLVLNADASPVKLMPLYVIPWQKAIKSYFEDRVDILETYDREVRSPSMTMKIPAVIMLREYVKPKNRVRSSKYNVYLRDEFRCQYCGDAFEKDNLTLDHVIPRYHGGKTSWTNTCAACQKCNSEKAHYLDMRPMSKPHRPDYWEMVQKRRQLPIIVKHESWLPYLGWADDLIVKAYQRAPRLTAA